MSDRPSFDLKLDRAEHHLNKLERAIKRYSDSHPYRVRERMNYEGDRRLHFFEFTKEPSDKIALIAGDFLYNTRASLDHIAGRLVSSAHRGHANFPILWQGVWEPSVEGDSPQEARDRTEWIRCTEWMPESAVDIIKANQPPKAASNVPSSHGLAILNSLRNRDAHQKLIAVSSGLMADRARCDLDGVARELRVVAPGAGRFSYSPGLIRDLPDGAMNVEIEGTVEVMIRAGLENGGYSVRETFRPLLLGDTRRFINALRPWAR